MQPYRHMLIPGFAAALALVGTACRSGTSAGSLSVTATSGSTAPAQAGTLDLGNGILVSEIRVAIQKVALESAQDGVAGVNANTGTPQAETATDQGRGGGEDGGAGESKGDEVEVGPCLVDLSGDKLMAGTTTLAPVCETDIPSGTYEEMEVEIGPITTAGAGAGTEAAAMNGRSVIVDGTFNGTRFSFQSTLAVEHETRIMMTVSTSSNVTIMVDPTGWFTGMGGVVLDPTMASNQQSIEDNIRASISAFEDDNRDGHEDGGGGRDGGGSGAGGGK